MTAVLSYDANILADALINVMQQPQIDVILFGYTLLYHIDDPCIYYLIEALKIVRDAFREASGNTHILLFEVVKDS